MLPLTAMKLLPLFLLLLSLTGWQPATAQKRYSVADTTRAHALVQQGKTLSKRSQYDSPTVYFEQTSQLYHRSGLWKQYFHSQNSIAENYWRTSQYDRSVTVTQQVMQESKQKLGEPNPAMAFACRNLSVVMIYQNKLDDALRYSQQSLALQQAQFGAEHPSLSKAYSDLSIIYNFRREYNQAIEAGLKAVRLREKSGAKDPAVAVAYQNIGNIYLTQENFEQAIAYYEKSRAILMEVDGEKSPGVANIYYNLSLIYEKKREIDRAMEHAQKALRLRREIYGENHAEVADAYSRLANLIGTMGGGDTEIADEYRRIDQQPEQTNQARYDTALVYHQKALAIRTAIFGDKHPLVAACYVNMGAVYDYQRQFDQALDVYQKALDIQQNLYGDKHPDILATYINISMMYLYQRNYVKAKEFTDKCLQLSGELYGEKHSDKAQLLNNMGYMYKMQRQPAQAAHFFQRALAANLPQFSDTTVYVNPTMQAGLPQILSTAYLLISLEFKAGQLYAQYQTSRSKKDLLASYQTYCLTDSLVDRLRNEYADEGDKLGLGLTASRISKQAIPVCLALHQTTGDDHYRRQAFYFSEKSKATVLASSLAESNARQFAGIPDSLLTQDNQLRQKIAQARQEVAQSDTTTEIQNRLFAANRQHEQLISRFEKEYPAYFQLKYQVAAPSTDQLQTLLDVRTALIEYTVGDSTLHAFVLTRQGLTIYTTPIDSLFAGRIAAFRESLASQDMALYSQTAHALYGQLFAFRLPKAIQHLIIIPDALLSTLPFEALLTKPAKRRKTEKRAYLLNQYAVTYAHSASLFYGQRMRQQPAATQEFIAFAPVFDDNGTMLVAREETRQTLLANDQFRTDAVRSVLQQNRHVMPLPATETEVQTVGKLFTAQNRPAQVYTRAQATESRVKAAGLARFAYVHFATHGMANESQPALSGLLLAPENTETEDGMLYTGEIYNLTLNADLVVLSACETGLGKVADGEGIIGLSRALLYAGARNIAVSLWKVTDVSTGQLMVGFYKNLLQSPDPAESLRKAKRSLIKQKQYADPYHWAAFVLIGSGAK